MRYVGEIAEKVKDKLPRIQAAVFSQTQKTCLKSAKTISKTQQWLLCILNKVRNFVLNEVDRIESNTSIWSVFWLLILTITSTIFIISYAPVLFGYVEFLFNLDRPLFSVIFGFTIIVTGFILAFLVKPIKQLGCQSVHNRPSWVFYTFWSIINSLIVISILIKKEWIYLPSKWNDHVELFSLHVDKYGVPIAIALVLIVCKWIFEKWADKSDFFKFTDFASGSVGIENDKLGFLLPAKNSAQSLLELNDYVNVAAVYGGFGFGKSSYARMIIENFDKSNVLYTYISLTETNEAKDFSKLFAERWIETLATRYPKIDITSYLPYMDSILRESGNGIISEILKVITAFNKGLVKTKAKYFDHDYQPKQQHTSDRVAKLFGNVNNIEEKLWVVMVDEIERAQFDEMYRIIEIIERFKSEGRSGLPVKLLFLFCISEPELKDYLNTFESSDPRVHLIKTFFYEDPKSISSRIFLPPVEPEVKLKFVLDLLNKFTDVAEVGVKDRNGKEIKNISAHRLGDPAREFKDHEGALGYIVATIQDESPRTIGRIITALEFFYGAFRDRFGELDKKSIRFSDVLALEYIKIKYPYLIDFFQKTIHILVSQSDSRGMSTYFLKKELEEKKMDLIDWIEDKTGEDIPESKKEEVRNLVGLVAYSYYDFLERDYQRDIKYEYVGSTSYPEILADYLTLLSDGTQTSYRKNNSLYQEHKDSEKNITTSLSNEDLVSYARFLFEVNQRKIVSLHLDVVSEIAKRMTSGKMKIDLVNVGDTILHEAAYQFVFQMVAIAEKDKDTEKASESITETYNQLKSVLVSPKVPIGTKYLILSSLVNSDRGSGSSIHHRLTDAFKRFLKYFEEDVRQVIRDVFDEADRRYLSGKNILYENEENFFYTLYQGWSGSPDDTEEITKINTAARRKLENYPKAIELYWSKYPIGEGWETLSDVFEHDHFFSMHDTNNPVYMPLETLIEVTKKSKLKDPEILSKLKFWEGIKDDPKLQEMAIVKGDNTLKSFLLKNGYL